MGRALSKHRDSIVLMTKVGYRVASELSVGERLGTTKDGPLDDTRALGEGGAPQLAGTLEKVSRASSRGKSSPVAD